MAFRSIGALKRIVSWFESEAAGCALNGIWHGRRVMPQPCSADLRERVLVAYEQGERSQVAIARPPTAIGSAKPARQPAVLQAPGNPGQD
jgi:hypothetical protein